MKTNSSQSIRSQLKSAQSGFTLVEMLLVLTILSILAGIVLPRLIPKGDDARKKATVAQMAAISTSLGIFAVDVGHYPAGKTGLNELIQKPRDVQNWSGPYLERLPKDAWGNDFQYVCPGTKHPLSFDIISAGKDGQFGTDDDIVNP